MISSNKLSVLYSNHIDSVTENASPSKTEHGWVTELNLSYTDLMNRVLSELPDDLLSSIKNVIIAGTDTDSNAKEIIHRNIHQGKKRSRPTTALQSLGTYELSWLYKKLNSDLNMFSVGAACASGIKAFHLASLFDNGPTLILGAEVPGSAEFVQHIFTSVGALSTADTWAPPFNNDVSGIMLGDGAGVVVVAPEKFTIEHNLKATAIIESIGWATIPTHITDPSDIASLEKLIDETIISSGIPKENFSYWDAHATATPSGDRVEMELHDKILPNIPISSYKARVGHTLAASSLVELSAAIKNFNDPTNRSFLKCSFGFGGQNGIMVVTVL